ncbi:MAG: tetratricopeptide repeat protein [Elusimicrobiales bacterium]
MRKTAPAIILAAALSAFWPAFRADFVNWDDRQYVTASPVMESPRWGDVFKTSPQGYYHPLTVLTYKIEHSLFGLKPAAYHATNIALHLANCLLFYYFALELGLTSPAALFAALLFAVHPLRAESVAWISGRKDLLCCLFFLAALLAHARHAKSPDRKLLAASAVLFLAALLAKPAVIAGVLAFFLIDRHFDRGWDRRVFAEKIPHFAAAAAAVLLSFTVGEFFLTSPVTSGAGLAPGGRLLSCGYTELFYLWKIIYPAKLSALYPALRVSGATAYLPYLAVVGSLAVLFSRAELRPYVFGPAFFAALLLPSAAFAELAPADRYTYIPAAGIFMLAGQLFAQFYARAKKPAAVLACALILALGWMCAARAQVWHDSLSLWNDVISRYPGAKAYVNRGTAYQELGRGKEALDDFNTAITLNPDYDYPYVHRAALLCDEKQYLPALADLDRALAMNPRYGYAYHRRGTAHYALGQYVMALSDFTEGLKYERTVDALAMRGLAYSALKLYGNAEEDFSAALHMNPRRTDVYAGRGRARFYAGRYKEAAADFARSLELKPDQPRLYSDLGAAYAGAGELEKAVSAYDAAALRDPGFSDAYGNRGAALAGLKQFTRAIEDLDKAIAMDPLRAYNYRNRAIALYETGRYAQAVSDLDRTIALSPQARDYAARGRAYLKLKKPAKARADFKKALSLDPADADALSGKAELPGH